MPLFDQLAERLATDHLTLQVAHPTVSSGLADRGDARTGSWSRPISDHRIPLGATDLHYRNTRALTRASRVVVAELGSTNLDLYRLVLGQRPPLVLWGHGAAFVTRHNRLDAALERWLARRADHLFVYTDEGVDYLSSRGITREKMTAVNNSTDTTGLRREMGEITAAEIDQFRRDHQLTGQHIAMFVGALDPTKELDLLLEAAALIRNELSDFQLIIAGGGPQARQLRSQIGSRPEIRLLPYANRKQLALIGAVSRLCLVPGRVGLVAVDAMVLGKPVITTDFPFHAPERAYLHADFCVSTGRNPSAYAAEVLRRIRDDAWLQAASAAAGRKSYLYSTESMAGLMSAVIVRLAENGERLLH